MTVRNTWERLQGRYRRSMSHLFFHQYVTMRNKSPLISFTFDDFPHSALLTGGAILKAYNIRGTYYTSIGLMGRESPVGTISGFDDLKHALNDGHELGCHTFAHCHAWETSPRAFERSVIDNRRALRELIPQASFSTLSYPISCPRPHTKRRLAKHFHCCRGGGQTFNTGRISRTHVNGYFLEQSGYDAEVVRRLIDRNCEAGGWLVFATHDVCEQPTRFGCSPLFFEAIVRHSKESGTSILPVAAAWGLVMGGSH